MPHLVLMSIDSVEGVVCRIHHGIRLPLSAGSGHRRLALLAIEPPRYVEAISDRGFKCDFSIDEMQDVQAPGNVWQFIIELYCVWMHEDASVDMVFLTRLDVEHHLYVLFRGTQVERVWME